MKIINRYYQDEAIDAAMSSDNGVIVASTGSGKSICISGIVQRLYPEKVLILQPSAEILESNIKKVHWAGLKDAKAYSASYGQKEIGTIVYATIKSLFEKIPENEKIKDQKENFRLKKEFLDYKNIIIDEAHSVNSSTGLYKQLLDEIKPKKLIGLTATPYRQHATRDFKTGAPLVETRLITRTKPKFLKKIIYIIGTDKLIKEGYLVDPEFHEIKIDDTLLVVNSTGADFTKKSITLFIQENDIVGKASNVVRDVKDSFKSIVVFMPDIESSIKLNDKLLEMKIPSVQVDSKKKKKENENNLKMFQEGKAQVIVNVRKLSVGWDHPALECIIDATPTRSPALHYQKIGRIVRPYEGKVAAVFDMAGNIERLGNPLKYELRENPNGTYDLWTGDRQISPQRSKQGAGSAKFKRFYRRDSEMPFGKYKGTLLKDVPIDYIHWMLNNLDLMEEIKIAFKTEMKHRYKKN